MNTSPPLVSVVVATYQHAGFIKECIAGILMQRTEFPVEILVGEDHSTDGTREICQQLVAQHPDRIRLFLNDRKDVIFVNGTPTGRWNVMNLMANCKGKYVAFCEGDDIWSDPEKLSTQVALMEEDPSCAGCYHETRAINHDGTDTGKLVQAHLVDRMIINDLIAPLSPFHTSSFLCRNSELLRALPKWMRTVASFDMALFAAIAGTSEFRKVEGVMSSYRKHPGGITMTAAHNGLQIHQQRIILWMNVDRHFGYRFAARCEEIYLHHWRFIVEGSIPRQRLRSFVTQARAVPSWFLRRPWFSVSRIRDIARL